MESSILIVLLLSIFVYLILNMRGDIKALNRHVMQLTEDLKKLVKPMAEIQTKQEKTVPEPKQESKPEIVPPTEKIFAEKSAETFKQKPVEQPVNTPEIKPVAEQKPIAPPVIVEQKKEPVSMPPPHSTVQPTPQKGFNFERFIGENLINKIGIGVLVIGIGLFVKYAIDNGWINEAGRVSIGFLCGAVLLAFAYRFRKLYRAFSSVLAGGGIVVFYFTVAIAFREYNLFGQTTSFLLMVAITGFSVWLSMRYDRRELAILSLIGGLLTPFMVSRGDGNYHVLFTYIAILDIGILALSLRKQWRELIIISFIGTQLIFWLFFERDFFNKNIARDSALLIYTTAFYIIFLLMPLVQVFRGTNRSKNYEAHIITLLANSFLYLLAGVLLLQRMDADNYKGLLTALLAVVNLVVAMLLRNNQKDKVLFHLFVGLAVGFVTLVAPMQFNSNNNVNAISLFWATEAVLLLWLFRKSNATLYYYASLILLGLTLIGIFILHASQQDMLADSYTHTTKEKIFINKYFITRLYVSLAFVLYRWQLLRHCNNEQFKGNQLISGMPPALEAIAVIMLFYTGIYELYLFTNAHYTSFWTMAYSFVFIWTLSFITKYRKIIVVLWGMLFLCYWLTFYTDGGLHYQLNSLVQNHISYGLAVVLSWIVFASLCGLFVKAGNILFTPVETKRFSGDANIMLWIFNIAAVITLSCAALEAISQISYRNIYINTKATITVLWSLCAFVQMWMGMHYKYKTLRIISLSLLGLVLCKLFLYDLRAVSQGAKIIAFVVLGVVLLVLSFLYQKLKKILFDDDEKSGG